MTKHRRFATKKHRSPLRAFVHVALLLLAVPVLIGTYIVATFDINAHRADLSAALTDAAARDIRLDGKIGWSFSLDHGLSLAVEKLTIGNPSWASRPHMAQIGQAKLHVAAWPLLQKRIEVLAFEMKDVSAQLETSPSGAVNWAFDTKSNNQTKDTAKSETKSAAAPVSVQLNKIAITRSRIGIKGKDGALTFVEIPALTITSDKKGTRLHYKGKVSGIALEADLTGGPLEGMSGAKWPFNLQVLADTIKLDARGAFKDGLQKIAIDEYLLENGETKAQGRLDINLSGARPALSGTLRSKALKLSDLTLKSDAPASTSAKKNESKGTGADAGKVFSRTPFDFSGLRSLDAHLAVDIEQMTVGLTAIKALSTKIDLANGRLALPAITGTIAGSAVSGNLVLDASAQTPQLSVQMDAPALDLSQIVMLGGVESAISGKSDFALTLQTLGRSPHDFAALSNGALSLTMNSGTISSSKLKDIAGSLLDLFAPGVGALAKPGINCLAARYTIKSGLMDTQGLLIDTDMTTIAGGGYVNLADERIAMHLRTKPKGVGVGSLVPPMKIGGTLAAPSFKLDAMRAAEKVVGLLTGGAQSSDGVPTLLTVPAGQNACVATLNNPAAAAAAEANKPTKTLVPSKMDAQGIKDAVKNVGDSVLKGLGKGLLGQ